MKHFSVIFLLLVLTMCGCQSVPASSAPPEGAPQRTAASAAGTASANSTAGAAGTASAANTAVLGRVSKISGNDITLHLGTYGGSSAKPSGDTSADAGTSADGGAGASTDTSTDADTSARSRPQRGTGSSEGGAGGEGGETASTRFVESGEELSVRIPVGTPILYGSLSVDFSQIQLNYIVNLTMGGGGSTVLSAEILAT